MKRTTAGDSMSELVAVSVDPSDTAAVANTEAMRVYVVVSRSMDPLDLDVLGVYLSAVEAQRVVDAEDCGEDGDCDVFVFGPLPLAAIAS